MLLKLKNEEKLKIIDTALKHIKMVETNPDIEFEDRDPYDAWLAFNERVDINISEGDLGNEDWREDGEPMEWFCSAYGVELSDDEFFRVNTDHMVSLFTYKDGKVTFHND